MPSLSRSVMAWGNEFLRGGDELFIMQRDAAVPNAFAAITMRFTA